MKTASPTYASLSGKPRRAFRPVVAACLALAAWLATAAPVYCGDCCPKPDLTIFYTSDTRGMLRRCGCAEGQMGGISARASYIKANGPAGRTLVLDAGDTFFPGLTLDARMRPFYQLKAGTIAEAMNACGYSASAVGDFDLAMGREFLMEAAGRADFPFLAANASWPSDDGATRPFRGNTVVNVGGVRVGVVGVLDSGFPYGDFPANFGPIAVSDPAEAAAREIKGLAGKADLIIVLTHLSVNGVEEFTGSLDGADIVIAGHGGGYMESPEIINGRLLLKGYMLAKQMGRMDIWLEHDRDRFAAGAKIVGFEFMVIPLDETIEPDPEVESIISGYRDELKSRAFVFEKPDPVGEGGFAGSEACGSCHADQYANWSRTRHAGAYATLTFKGDQYDPECLPCHTTGYGYASGYAIGKDGPLVNVGCESCHGRGEGHVAVRKGSPITGARDMVMREVSEQTCMGCHDEPNSPFFEYELYMEKGGSHRGDGAGDGK